MTSPVKQERYGKQAALDHWGALPDNAPIEITPIGTKHKGSTYAKDCIRITGSKTFIDSVLSNLKGFLDHENGQSRLEILYTQTLDTDRNKETGQITVRGLSGAWGCYLKVKDRGRGTGAPRKRKEAPVNGTDSTIELADDDVIEAPKVHKKKEVEQSDYKRVNAGLERRDKLRAAKKAGAIGSKNDPLFAIGTKDEEEECGYAWTEPEDGVMPMRTYEDFTSCDSECSKLGKSAAFKKVDLQIVEVWKDSKGKIHCNDS